VNATPFSPSSPEPSSPGSPFAREPQLGIIHLMVWTACTAVYFSLYRVMVPDDSARVSVLTYVDLSKGIGAGAALGGLLLYVARRYPWTHWLGVGVNLFFGATNLVMALAMTLFPNA